MKTVLAIAAVALSLNPVLLTETPDMSDPDSSQPGVSDASMDSIHGRTIRWTWTEGPVEGVTHEHVFRADGSVEWRVISGPREGHSAVEDEYGVFEVSETVRVVSYRAASGYTLTVVLNFATGEMFGFASGREQWHPGRGTFEVVE